MRCLPRCFLRIAVDHRHGIDGDPVRRREVSQAISPPFQALKQGGWANVFLPTSTPASEWQGFMDGGANIWGRDRVSLSCAHGCEVSGIPMCVRLGP